MVGKALEGSRRAIEWHRKLLTHYGHGWIDACHSPQHAGYKIAALEACRISAIRQLVVSPAVDVVKDWTWQPALGQFPEVLEIMTIA
jgi:hypothetical protein